MKYYICKTCGNLIEKIEDGGNTPYCCNKPMQELFPASTDGALEKHVPICVVHDFECSGINMKEVFVEVGESHHPSTAIHYIKWIEIETTEGVYRKTLYPGDAPFVRFYISKDEEVISVYTYCNLHGLWKAAD